LRIDFRSANISLLEISQSILRGSSPQKIKKAILILTFYLIFTVLEGLLYIFARILKEKIV